MINIMICVFSIIFVILAISMMYIKFGWFKRFFHNTLKWHIPDISKGLKYDGASFHGVCKHCGKEIIQDSQGNWF